MPSAKYSWHQHASLLSFYTYFQSARIPQSIGPDSAYFVLLMPRSMASFFYAEGVRDFIIRFLSHTFMLYGSLDRATYAWFRVAPSWRPCSCAEPRSPPFMHLHRTSLTMMIGHLHRTLFVQLGPSRKVPNHKAADLINNGRAMLSN